MPSFSLIPRDKRLFELLNRHIAITVEAADALAVGLADSAEHKDLQACIKRLEHDGDDVTHDLVETLNRTFITPFDREDIYALISALDDVLDLLEEVSDTMVLYRITEAPPLVQDLAGYIAAAVHELEQAIAKLETKESIASHGMEVDRLENLGDRASRQAISDLFSDGRDAVEIIKLKDLYGALEATLDRCEDVANVLESVTIKNA